MLTFQQIILTPTELLGQTGLRLAATYDMEVGRVPRIPRPFCARSAQPWKAAYVQPSRRPKDGRYGENPIACSIIINFKWC